MNAMKNQTKTMIAVAVAAVVIAAVLFPGCPVADNELVREPVAGIALYRGGVPVPPGPDGLPPGFRMLEGRAVVLGAALEPAGVSGGIHWQTSRDVVELNRLSGPEVVLYGRYGGDAIIQITTANIFNELPVFGEVRVTVVPTSYFKWYWELDGWDPLPGFTSTRIGRYHQTFVRSAGETAIAVDERRGGMVLEGPGILVIGSTMAVPTNSPLPDDPAFDAGGELNFNTIPGNRFLGFYDIPCFPRSAPVVGISVDYEVLIASAPRQGLRIQVNNNTLARDMASPLENWLVAELTEGSPRSGMLRGVFNTAVARLDPELHPGKRDLIPGIDDDEKVLSVLGSSFVSLGLPEGKVLIRNIRIYNVYDNPDPNRADPRCECNPCNCTAALGCS